jgi:hypothetical protein
MNADNFSDPQQNSAFTPEVGQVEQMAIGDGMYRNAP